MKKFTKYTYVRESLDSRLKDKLSEDNKSLKRGILVLLDDTLQSEDMVELQKFIDSYIEDQENNVLVGLVDDPDIFDFYLKYQNNIDELCQDLKYFETSPNENNIFSLYDVIIHGTKFAVLDCMKKLYDDIFEKE